MADLLFALVAYVTANLKQEIICCKAGEAVRERASVSRPIRTHLAAEGRVGRGR